MFTLLCIYILTHTHTYYILYYIDFMCILIFLSLLINIIYIMNVIKLTTKYGN